MLSRSAATVRLGLRKSPCQATSHFTTTSSTPSTPTASTSTSPPPSSTSPKPTHYLLTLLRSPLHLPKALAATCNSLGLGHRLASSFVPITPTNAGAVLAIKELVAVKPCTEEDIKHAARGRERAGAGRQGVGLRWRGGVIRVGSERARGDERGFKVLEK